MLITLLQTRCDETTFTSRLQELVEAQVGHLRRSFSHQLRQYQAISLESLCRINDTSKEAAPIKTTFSDPLLSFSSSPHKHQRAVNLLALHPPIQLPKSHLKLSTHLSPSHSTTLRLHLNIKMASLLINGSTGRNVTDVQAVRALMEPGAWSALDDQTKRFIYTMLPMLKDAQGQPIELDLGPHPARNPVIGPVIVEFLDSIKANHGSGFERQAYRDEARVALAQLANGQLAAAQPAPPAPPNPAGSTQAAAVPTAHVAHPRLY
ncbi:hypothetical protein KVT40_006602 [Elsinoe batatas]|uniref:Uncharacterized protein n=1 Tax=Elsinoe batatas TaxID=2601811 RepID=A0A8K0KXY5_9PEZI|nr:hypothetical protein KVT40_006602 [Elsinoe batatas]